MRRTQLELRKLITTPQTIILNISCDPLRLKKLSGQFFLVDEEIISALQKYFETQNKLKQRLGAAYIDKDFIFAKHNRFPGYPYLI